MFDSLHVRRLTPRIALAVAFVAMLTAGNAAASNTTITLDGTPITATTTLAGEKAGISFTGTALHRVSVRVSSSTVTNYTIALKAPDGSIVKTSGTWGVAGGFMGPVTLPNQTGTYKFILTPASTLKGKWTVAAWDVPADLTGAIATDGTQTTQTYSAPGQNGTLTFSGSVGQRISLLAGSGVATSAKNVTVSIKAPSGATTLAATAVGTGGMFFDPITLAENGTYTISVNPPKYTTGTTAFQLWTVPTDQGGTLTLGTPQALTFNTPGQNASYTFTGTSGQKITFSATSSSINSTIKIKKPDNTVLSTLTTVSTASNAGALMEPTTLPASGTYTVTVDPTAQATGSVTINAFVSPADLSGSLTSGTPTTASLSTVGQNASYTVTGNAGQYLAVKFDQDNITSAKVTVLTPANAVLGTDTATIGTTGKFFDGVVLPTTGTYKVNVDPQGTYTGNVNVTAYVYSNPSTQTATVGTPLVVTTVPGQNAQITFTAAAKDSIQFSNVTAGSAGATGVVATLYLGSTQVGGPWTFGNIGSFIDSMNLTAGSTYKLLLDPQGQNAGSITTTIYSVPADATTTATVNTSSPGTAANLSFGTPGQNGSITFTGTAGHAVSLYFTNVTIGNASGSGTAVTLWSPSNTQVANSSFTLNQHDTLIEPVTLPSTGTYTLKFDPAGNFTGGFSLNVYDVPADATGTATINGTSTTATTVVPGQNMQITVVTSSTAPVTISYDVTSSCSGVNLSLYKAGVLVTNWGNFNNAGDTQSFTPASATTTTYVVKVNPAAACIGDALIFATQ
jgi:hypothetical protein